jgi:hypothetical protein
MLNPPRKMHVLRSVPMHESQRFGTTWKTTSFLMNKYPVSGSFMWLRDIRWSIKSFNMTSTDLQPFKMPSS